MPEQFIFDASEPAWQPNFGNHGASTRSIVRGLRFDGFGGGQLPVPVRFGAGGTGMQFTHLPDCCSASTARHGHDLFRGEFFSFHQHIVHRSGARKMFNIAQAAAP